jgi:hypothetical protein
MSAAQALEARFPGLLDAVKMTESGGNNAAVSPKGARGLYGLMPGTASDLGVNPTDPDTAREAAARYLTTQIDGSGGDLDRGLQKYNAGPHSQRPGYWDNPNNIPQETKDYPGRVLHFLQGGQSHASNALPPSGRNPFDPGDGSTHSGAATLPPTGNNPFDPGDGGATTSPHGSVAPVSVGGNAGQVGLAGNDPRRFGNQGRAGAASHPVGFAGNAQPVGQGISAGTAGGTPGGPGGGLQQDQGLLDGPGSRANGLVDSALSGFTAHLVHPLTAGLNTLFPLDRLSGEDVHSVWDGSSLSDAFKHNMGIENGHYQQFQQAHPLASGLAELGGGIASPFNKIGMPVKGAGLVANGARLALGGGVYGGVSSLADNGDLGDAARSAGIGAVAAPALGAVIAPAAKGANALATAVRNAVSKTPGLDFAPAAFRKTIQSMIESGSSVGDVVKAAADAGHPVTPESVQKYVDYRTAGGKNPAGFAPPVGTPHANVDIEINQPGTAAYDGPGKLNINPSTGERSVQPTTPQPAPKDLAAALGSRSAGTGLEATAPLPDQVAGDVQRLTAHGVTPEYAQAEADTKYVGGQPTQGIVTRNFHLQQAEKEGAKLNTPAGLAARDVLDSNNAALHTATQETIANYGGKVEPGAASEAAAKSLASTSDAEKAQVSRLYAVADKEHGYMPPTPAEPNISDTSSKAPGPFDEKPKVDAPDERDALSSYTSTSAYGNPVRRKGPMDLLTWLRAKGGIQDSGGDLKSMGVTNKPRNLDFARNEAFLGPLINDRGMALDRASEAAHEAGFFPHHQTQPDNSDLLEMIRSTHDGYGGERIFHPDSHAELDDFYRMQDERYRQEQAAGEHYDHSRFSDPTHNEMQSNRPSLDVYADEPSLHGAVASAKPLYRALDDVAFKAAVTTEGRALGSGTRRALNVMTENGKIGLSPQKLERLRKIVGGSYNPMGGEVNSLAGQMKGHIDRLFDELGDASPAYKAAREAHKNWAQQYDNPEGVANLIKRDAKGNFANADKWRQADGSLLNSVNDRQFVQVARQLKANGDTATINKLKASVVQGAYAKASSSAPDSSRNSVFSGKAWFHHLDTKVGTAKLKALFGPAELAHIATIGRAARHINEAVPGVTNGSSSGSMLLNSGLAEALRGLNKAEPARPVKVGKALAKGLVMAAGYHAGGPIGVMGGKYTADALETTLAKVAASKAAQRADAAVSESINPALARAMGAMRDAKASSKLKNRDLARKVTGKIAPAASNDDEVKSRTRALAKALRG